MRRLVLIAVLAAAPFAAMAQSSAPQKPGPDQTITRQQFIDHASARAGKRFDAIDTNHTGVITVAQLRAFRHAHRMHHGAPAQAPVQTPAPTQQ